jgi:hypothetical protein
MIRRQGVPHIYHHPVAHYGRQGDRKGRENLKGCFLNWKD